MNSASDVITVSELNRKARLAIEKSLPSCWVGGEISNFTQASSGHWYFTLKDAQSSVKCAFFRNRNQFTDWRPSEGNKIEVRAQATLYEPRGNYQLVVDAIRRAGQGNLFEEFLRLKAKLEGRRAVSERTETPLACISENHRHRHIIAGCCLARRSTHPEKPLAIRAGHHLPMHGARC